MGWLSHINDELLEQFDLSPRGLPEVDPGNRTKR
jgi:hypothetical protein